MKLFALFILFLALVSASGFRGENIPSLRPKYSTEQKSLEYLWEKYKQKYERNYDSEEETLRFGYFVDNINRINARNLLSEQKGWNTIHDINKFTDMSQQEFKQKMLMPPREPTSDFSAGLLDIPKSDALPAVWDWRSKGAVTPVKNQGQCGSCWAFSTVENVESVAILASKGKFTNTTLKLSEQQVVDCDDSDDGCGGGNPPTAYDYIINAGGLESESAYPYHAVNQQCKFKKSDVVLDIKSWKWATDTRNQGEVQNALVNWAPLSICVDAEYWSSYSGGVMTPDECAWFVRLDHCVQLVGYNTQASTPYWIVRNSWGPDWGLQGYIHLEYGHNTCGMLNEVSSSVF